MFALDWKQKGHKPGGKLYKTNFAQHIYFAHTGRPPPLETGSRVEQQDFKTFKKHHQKLITSCNFLLELYRKVLASHSQPHIDLILFTQFGAAILLDPAWEVDNLAKCTKTFRTVFKRLKDIDSAPVHDHCVANTSVFMTTANALTNNDITNHFQCLMSIPIPG